MHVAVILPLYKCHRAVHVEQGSGLTRVQGGCCLRVTALCQYSLHCWFGQSLIRKDHPCSVSTHRLLPAPTSISKVVYGHRFVQDMPYQCLAGDFSSLYMATAFTPTVTYNMWDLMPSISVDAQLTVYVLFNKRHGAVCSAHERQACSLEQCCIVVVALALQALGQPDVLG